MAQVRLRAKALCFGADDSDACGGVIVGPLLVPGLRVKTLVRIYGLGGGMLHRQPLGASSRSFRTFWLQHADGFGHALILACNSLDSAVGWSLRSPVLYTWPHCHRSRSHGTIDAPWPGASGQMTLSRNCLVFSVQ